MTAQHTAGFKHQFALWALAVGLGTLTVDAAPPVRISFSGDSTLHGFQGDVTTVQVRVDESGEPAMIRIMVPVRDMHTGHDGRDSRMYAMFETSPPARPPPEVIVGVAEHSALWSGEEGGRVPISLTLHGRTHVVTAARTVIREAGTPPVIRLTFEVSLQRFGLTPPVVLGMIRVRDTVRVTADFPETPIHPKEEAP